MIDALIARHLGEYSLRLMCGVLKGMRVSTKRVARVMREDGLAARRPRSVRTTDSTHAHPTAPHLLERQFDVKGVGVHQVWVSDITYVPTDEG